LDLVVFLVNLVLMGVLTRYFRDLLALAGENDVIAQLVLLTCGGAMLVLPAAGASLKRWHFHQRRSEKAAPRKPGLSKKRKKRNVEAESKYVVFEGWQQLGCLFSSLFFLVLSIVLSAMVMTLLQSLFFAKGAGDSALLWAPLVILLFTLCVVQTVLVYRYFLRPKKPPAGSFWRDPKSEQLADLFIFVNMILFQVFWNIVVEELPWSEGGQISDIVGNLFVLSFVALLIYVPPRIFFLAEDYRRPTTWLTILLANMPTILRIFVSGQAGW